MWYLERIAIVDILEIINCRSLLLMHLSTQSLRNLSKEFPNVQRQPVERLINFYLSDVIDKIITKGTIF